MSVLELNDEQVISIVRQLPAARFRRIWDGTNTLKERLPFDLVMVPKASNSTGLQIADLVARPIGINVLRPAQQNRAYDIVAKKLRRNPSGEHQGWGLKVFP